MEVKFIISRSFSNIGYFYVNFCELVQDLANEAEDGGRGVAVVDLEFSRETSKERRRKKKKCSRKTATLQKFSSEALQSTWRLEVVFTKTSMWRWRKESHQTSP